MAGRTGAGRTLLRELLAWAPVWLPLALVAQLGLRGLRPALAEDQRLREAETRVRHRHEQAQERRAEVERLLRAQDDPIYQERERRSWEDRAPTASGDQDRDGS